MHVEIESRREAIAALCRRYSVTRLEVFGSAARGDDFEPARSDADFLVEFDSNADLSALKQYFGFAEDLKQLLGRPVDLLSAGSIENPYLRAAINRSKELVYAA
jgi:hypothetical protein